MNCNRLQDAIRKLEARNRLVRGGTQYTPEVSAGVAAAAKGREMMRKGPMPVPLRTLVKKNGR